MIIQLNGRSHETEDGQSVARLVETLGLRPGMVAVEVNEHVVTRDRRETTILKPADQVELVTIMGGG
jgi:thiamine biosynthesis protein ThiS